MFFKDIAKVEEFARKTGFSIYVLPEKTEVKLNGIIELSPDSKNKIGIEAVREAIDSTISKQSEDFFIVVHEAEKMSIAAQNAFLKSLEEPSEHYHIVFIVNNLSGLLPTVLSRGDIYILEEKDILEEGIKADETVKNYARKLLATSGKQLVSLAEEITKNKEYKKKDNARPFTLSICESAIEIAYKSYFKTKNQVFLKKLPNLLNLYDNLKKNGNIKLHIVADLC